jgi:epoxyqueuosine reductase
MPPSNTSLTEALKAEAFGLGFADCRVTGADHDFGDGLDRWLAEGMHGEMGWMGERAHQRRGPKALWPEAQSVIMLGMSYAPDVDPLAMADARDRGRVSAYAQGRDYHDVVKKALKALARWLVDQTGCELKVFVDTAPVMEKPLAAAAGLGWQGKHSNLVSREHGSWLFLGAVFTTIPVARLTLPSTVWAEPVEALPSPDHRSTKQKQGFDRLSPNGGEWRLEPDPPEREHCGTCTACQTACPTGAFPAPYRVDARRCISYLTIEHSGPIPHEFRRAIGNRVYGCDDCLAVCPWNKFAKSAHANRALVPFDGLAAPALAELLAMNDAAFRAFFRFTPVKRIGRNRMVRNAAIAAGNSGDAALVPLLESLRDDPDPVVVDAVEWALGELSAAPSS